MAEEYDNSEFVQLLKNLQTRLTNEKGELVKHLIKGDGEQQGDEEDHEFCNIIDDAFEHSVGAMFDELPMPLQMLACTVLRHTYHEFGHLMLEIGRQYEIDNALTPEAVQDITAADLAKGGD